MTDQRPSARQSYALANPLNRADLSPGGIEGFKAVDVLPSGNLLCSILAVDR